MANEMKDIAQLLPEGLSEEAVSEIAEMVSTVIHTQVDERVGLLEAKVNAFLRTKVDELKEQAIKELTEENPIYRNARLFESVRTLMTLELNGEDENNAIHTVNDQKGKLNEEVEVLTEELNRLVVENQKLETTMGAMAKKTSLLEEALDESEEEKEFLTKEKKELKLSQEKPFKSSEKALVISESEEGTTQRRSYNNGNEFLTNEVMKYMPFNESN
jgi:chromosome segregation ATPase